MKITRLEDITTWKAARQLTRLVYIATEGRGFQRDTDLSRQKRGAAVSAMANIAEGFDSGSDPEFRRFLKIARRSVTELQSHLYVAADRKYIDQKGKYIDQKGFEGLYTGTRDVKNLIGGFLRHLKKSRIST